MTIIRGAWVKGGYSKGQVGALGEDLTSYEDNIGWALRAWKYELVYNGHRGRMILDSPVFGDAMRNSVIEFQTNQGIGADGVIGPITGKKLLDLRTFTVAAQAAGGDNQFLADLRGIIAHESAWDIGAIGYVDPSDRGPTQYHVTLTGSVNLSQAIRPALAVPRLAAQLDRLRKEWDEDAAVVSWNCGEGGAEWWFENGKPDTGSPAWWHGDEPLGQRATEYLAAVRQAA